MESKNNQIGLKIKFSSFAIILFLFLTIEQVHSAGKVSVGSGSIGSAGSTALYEETVVDMEIQTLGGKLALERHWANGRWTFNPDWADLQFFRERKKISVGTLSAGSAAVSSDRFTLSNRVGSGIRGTVSPTTDKSLVETIRRNVHTYEAVDDEHNVYRNELRKTITRVENGFLWTNREGDWIEYNQEAQATRFGNRNNIALTLARDAEGRVEHVIDHFGATLVTYTYDADGHPLTLTDYTGRTVTYTWEDRRLTAVKDVRGNTWQYEYEQAVVLAAMKGKIDPEGRTTLIDHVEQSGGFESADGGSLPNYSVSVGSGSGAVSMNRSQTFLSTTRDEIGVVAAYRYFYDDQEKVYKNITEEPERGRVATTTNLRGEPIEVYINDELLYKADIANNRRHKVETDKNEYATTKNYDEFLNLTSAVYADGSRETWTYNQYSQVLRYTDENGVVTENEYDENGNLLRTTEAKGKPAERVTEYEYDNLGRMTLMRQVGDANTPEAVTRWTSYDNYGNPLIQIDPAGVETRYTYDVLGNILTHRDGRSNTWTYTYDAAGNLLTETDPHNHTVTYSYDKVGNLISITNALNIPVVTYSYNARNSVTSMTNAYNQTQIYVYNARNQLIEVRDENNKVTKIDYDASGRPVKVVDPVGNIITMLWGGEGAELYGLSEIQYPTFSERYTYDKRYRVTRVERYSEDIVLQTVRYQYDPAGNLSGVTDPKGRASLTFYDELNRVTRTQDPAANTVSLAYDDRDNLISVTNELNVLLRQYTYTLRDEQYQEVWPNGSTFTSTYDANGNLDIYADAKGQIHKHIYDAANRLTNTNYFTDSEAENPVKSVSYTYNDVDSLTGYDDGTTSAIYAYDNMQRATTSTTNYGAFSKSHTYTYNATGQKSSLLNPDNSLNEYYYDAAQKLNRIHLVGQGNIIVNSYKWLGPEKVTYPGGSTQQNTYDPLMRLQTIDVKDPAQNSILNYVYSFDEVGNITEKATEHGNYGYSYDELDRLIAADNPQNTALTDEAFTYDATGNRLTSPDTEGNWQYNSTNQLIKAGDNGFTYQYDANGSLTSKTLNNVTENYIYDIENRLIEVRDNTNNLIASYNYDPFGRRISKTTTEGTQYFYYADEGLIAEFDGTGNQIQAYGFTPESMWGTDPTFMKDNINSYFYYLNDHLGTPQKLLQPNGAIVWSAHYQSYGLATVSPNITTANPLRFPGQYFDGETNTHYNYFRNYNPRVGRYVQSDPLGLLDGMNSYRYAYNNPLINMDPTGELVPIGVAIGIGIGIGTRILLKKILKKMAKNALKHGARSAAPSLGSGGKDPDSEKCRRLAEKIENLRKEVYDKRIPDLESNPNNLPERIGPGEKMRDTRRGHRKLLDRQRRRLGELEDRYDKECKPDPQQCP